MSTDAHTLTLDMLTTEPHPPMPLWQYQRLASPTGPRPGQQHTELPATFHGPNWTPRNR